MLYPYLFFYSAILPSVVALDMINSLGGSSGILPSRLMLHPLLGEIKVPRARVISIKAKALKPLVGETTTVAQGKPEFKRFRDQGN